MRRIRRIGEMVLAALFLFCWTVPCFAVENTFREMLQDTVVGAVAGTIVGVAVMAFARKPGDHLEYMAVGAAAGVLVGAAYGAYETTHRTRAVAEVDQGKVKFSIPTIIPDLKESSKGQTGIGFMTELVRGKF